MQLQDTSLREAQLQRGGCTQSIIIRSRLHRFTILIRHVEQMGRICIAIEALRHNSWPNQIGITYLGSAVHFLNQAAVSPTQGQPTLHHTPCTMLLELSIETVHIFKPRYQQQTGYLGSHDPSPGNNIYGTSTCMDRTSPEMILRLPLCYNFNRAATGINLHPPGPPAPKPLPQNALLSGPAVAKKPTELITTRIQSRCHCRITESIDIHALTKSEEQSTS